MNQVISESEILELLRNNDCEVTFTKVNGESRTMPCTLRSDSLPTPVIKENSTPSTRVSTPGVIAVWCLDRQEWRSFRVSSLVSIVKIPTLTQKN